MHIQPHSQTLNYSGGGILMHIQPLTGAQLQGREEASSVLFENRKKCPDFGEKGPDCVHLWVKLSIQNVILRVCGRKNSKIFSCWDSFSCVFDKMFTEVP